MRLVEKRNASTPSCSLWRALLAQWRRSKKSSEAREALTEGEEDLLRRVVATARPGSWIENFRLAPWTRALERHRQGLTEKGMLESCGEGVRLTERGHKRGLALLRSHRLVERHLAESTGLPAEEWHPAADRLEHGMDRAALEALEQKLGHPRFDPHGDPIPCADGELPELQGLPLDQLSPGAKGKVLHVEDEPEEVFREITALGFVPGERFEWIAVEGDRMRFRLGGEEKTIPRRYGPWITVREDSEESPSSLRPLSSLALGEEAQILELAPACRGPERRRLLDLGFVPGTRIRAELRPPSGDPTAYRVRDTLIALRQRQADWIRVTPLPATGGRDGHHVHP